MRRCGGHRRVVGRTQQELARAVGLHPNVLSHQLNGHDGASLTTESIGGIITTLAGWGAVTTRAEVAALLAFMAVPANAISEAAWTAPPFAALDPEAPAPRLQVAQTHDAGPHDQIPQPTDGRQIASRLRPSSLPAPTTPFIERAAECATIHAALVASRLVTLTGVGGTGKTRLSLQMARDLTPNFSDGVAFVDLAPIRDPALLPITMMRALGLAEQPALSPEECLLQALRPTQLLLVVDNLEHLVEEASLLARLLAAAPDLHVLATSRVPLRLYGEHEIRVPPLRLSGNEPETGTDPGMSEAVQLFVQRARAVRPTFDLQGDNLATVGAICAALDGLPLAIELAAARAKLFSPDALLPLLGARLTVLTGGPRDLPDRQQTLRAALDWSYTLLTEDDRRLFARLGAFSGSFDATAAAVVDGQMEDAMATLDHLATLADQSLIEIATGPTPRFRLLETLREYALARLAESGELETIRERHATYFMALAEDALGPERSPSASYLNQLEMERDNLHAAMAWARDAGQTEVGLRLVCAHSYFWMIRGHCVEGQRWAEEALEIEGVVSPHLRGGVLDVAGTMARLRGDMGRAMQCLEQSLALAREAADGRQIAKGCQELGIVVACTEKAERAQSLFEESLVLTRAAGSARGVARSTHLLAWLAAHQGELERAQELWEESLRIHRELGDQARVALVLLSLGWNAVLQGAKERAKALLLESVDLGEQVGYAVVSWGFLESMALMSVLEGEVAHAAQFLGAADVARTASGEVLEPPDQADVQRTVEAGRAQIGEAAWDEAWREGRAMSIDMAIALAKADATGEQRGRQVAAAHHGAE